MNQDNTNNTLYNEHNKPPLSSGLNVLTILSFIGCAIQLISSVWGFINAKKSYDSIDKLTEQMNSVNMPGWTKVLIGDPENIVKVLTKSYENKIPIFVLSLIAVGFCFYGVLQMRNLKKQGFRFYTIGQLLPFLTQGLFIGAFAFLGFTMYFVIALTLLFIILYALQRKYLIYT